MTKLSLIISFLLFGLNLLSYAEDTEWSVFIGREHLNDEAVKVSLEDLQKTGRDFGIIFNITKAAPEHFKNAIVVGDGSRNTVAAELIKNKRIKLAGVDDPEGYEITTIEQNDHKVLIVAGGSVIGDVHGLYWILDRLRVFKQIPDINVTRVPSLKIRYSRIRVKSKKDVKRALRWGLNLVYGGNPLALIPWDSEPERTENRENREKIKELIDYAHKLHLKFLTFGTDFTFHPSLLKECGATLSPCDPFFWDAVQTKYRKLLQSLPELDGIATFTGEEQSYWGAYRTFDPMHDGDDCDWSLEKRYRTFVKKVHNVVVGEFGKIYHHRTWITNPYEQQSQPEVYAKIFTRDVPVDNLYLIPSFTQNDRWWFQAFNPTFNVTSHHMLAVMEPMNYHEGSSSNIFPTFPGQYFQAGLQSILGVPNSNLQGVSFDLYAADDFGTANLTAYTVFRLSWDYREDIKDIARDFAAIHFGTAAARGMAEICLLSPVAYKYGLYIEPVAYGQFNSLPHIRVGTFPAQGFPGIDNGKAHVEFLRKIYLRCKPWIPETLLYLDHGLEVAKTMQEKYRVVRPLVEDKDLAQKVANALDMTLLLVKTNNLYVKTFFAYFNYREKPTPDNRDKLASLFSELKRTRAEFAATPGFGYRLFGVDQLLKNVEQALEDLPKAEQLLSNAPDEKEVKRMILNQQKQYARLLETHRNEAIRFFHFRGKIDGRDVLLIKNRDFQIEHLRWDPPLVQAAKFYRPLPAKDVTVVARSIKTRPLHPFILQQPAAENNYTVKVYLYDVPGGSDWWEFDLYFLQENSNR